MGPQSLHFLRELGRRVGRQTGDPLASFLSPVPTPVNYHPERGNSAYIMGGLRGHDYRFSQRLCVFSTIIVKIIFTKKCVVYCKRALYTGSKEREYNISHKIF